MTIQMARRVERIRVLRLKIVAGLILRRD